MFSYVFFPFKKLKKLKSHCGDTWVAQSVKRLPSAQVMILGSWGPVPHLAPCSVGSLLLPPPLSLPLLMLSLPFSLSQINKFKKSF